MPDETRLAEAEASVVKYFQETPSGKCSWHRGIYHPNGEAIIETKYDIAYHENQISWYQQSIRSGVELPGINQFYILNDKQRIYWMQHSETAALQIRPLACFNGNPMLGAVLHPRYIGTGLNGVIGDLINKSPRGIFADGGLERRSAESTVLDGKPVLKGTYKWDVWDVDMYFSSSEPTVLLKTVTSALSDTGVHRKTVTLEYGDWECGIQYPARVEFDYSIKDVTTRREVVTITDFDVLDENEIGEAFTTAALGFPEGGRVVVTNSSCTNVNRFHMTDGELVPWTQKELDDYMRSLSLAVVQNNAQADSVDSSSAAAVVVAQSRPWMLYAFALALLIICGTAFLRLTRQATAA